MIEHTNADLEQALVESIKPARGRRFLAAGGRAGNGSGYLSQPPRELPPVADEPVVVERIAAAVALCDEPEVVGVDLALTRHYAALRHAANVEVLQGVRKTLSLEARMANARSVAKRRHVDLRQELFVIAKMGERHPAAASTRMEAVEERLDRPVDEKLWAA